jgi:hypothetical protein
MCEQSLIEQCKITKKSSAKHPGPETKTLVYRGGYVLRAKWSLRVMQVLGCCVRVCVCALESGAHLLSDPFSRTRTLSPTPL